FLNHAIDKSYFVYLYNENKEVLKEKNKQLQGTTVVQKLTKSGLNSLLLPMVSLEKQQEIGQIYLKLQQLKKKMYQQIDNLDQFTIQILEGKINSENK
ncbi:MAG TPA: restriction endonuclease subunit S, partial [Enterococcus cecorum]|nr:restriction endonuclease subunit S [Enterococcus cecorum]